MGGGQEEERGEWGVHFVFIIIISIEFLYLSKIKNMTRSKYSTIGKSPGFKLDKNTFC